MTLWRGMDGWVDASPWHVSASVCFLCLIHFGCGLSQSHVVEDLTNEIMDSLKTLGRNYSQVSNTSPPA